MCGVPGKRGHRTHHTSIQTFQIRANRNIFVLWPEGGQLNWARGKKLRRGDKDWLISF